MQAEIPLQINSRLFQRYVHPLNRYFESHKIPKALVWVVGAPTILVVYVALYCVRGVIASWPRLAWGAIYDSTINVDNISQIHLPD